MTRIISVGVFLGVLTGLLISTLQNTIGAPVVYAREPDPPRVILIGTKIEWTEDRINQEIETKAKEYGVSASEMKRVIKCESHGSTTIQSHHRYTFTDTRLGIYEGDREQSYGLSQIHLPHHPTVTKEQAQDPQYAIEFMAKHFAQGKQTMWNCY